VQLQQGALYATGCSNCNRVHLQQGALYATDPLFWPLEHPAAGGRFHSNEEAEMALREWLRT